VPHLKTQQGASPQNTTGCLTSKHDLHSTKGLTVALYPFIFRIQIFNSYLLYEEVINHLLWLNKRI